VEFSDAVDQLDQVIAATPSTPDDDVLVESSESSDLARMSKTTPGQAEPLRDHLVK